MLHSICQQIWKTQQWPQDWKRSVFIPMPKKAQTTTQLHSFHMLARSRSKSFKLGFNGSFSGSCAVLELPWGDTPHPRSKEKPRQDDRRGKFTFRIRLHSHQRYSEGSNKPCAHQDPETPQRLRQNCVWVSPVEVQVSSGPPAGQGLWVQQTWVWHKPFLRRSPLTLPRSC